MKITTVGLDLAKSVFTLQGVDERGNIVLRETVRRVRRFPSVLRKAHFAALTHSMA
jgi:hypothetical protein